VRGRAALGGLLRGLGALEASGAIDLSRAIDLAVRQATRPGLLAVFSDFFDGGAVLAALGRARAAGHDVALIQVVLREEQEPTLEGDLLLVDAETDATIEVTADASALEAYMLRFAGLCEELRRFARKRGATYVRALADEPLEGVVRRIVSRSID
jgi:hypothetical protein